MILYVREALAQRDKVPEALAFATDIATHVAAATAIAVTPWTTVYGAPLGGLAWTASVDSLAVMECVGDQLRSDARYLELVDGAADLLATPAQDTVSELVGTAGPAETDGGYATVVTAQCAPGRVADALAWAVDVMNHVSDLTGQSVSLVRGLYGPWATLAWITRSDTIGQVEAGNAATAADPTYLEKVDGAGELFVSGATYTRLLRRLG